VSVARKYWNQAPGSGFRMFLALKVKFTSTIAPAASGSTRLRPEATTFHRPVSTVSLLFVTSLATTTVEVRRVISRRGQSRMRPAFDLAPQTKQPMQHC
jgi:hypothetical protein